MTEDDEKTPGGSRILRYGEARQPGAAAEHRGIHFDRLVAHVERHVGPVGRVLREPDPEEEIAVDVLVVAADRERAYHVLVTAGMSDRPMNVSDIDDPADRDDNANAELMMVLSADTKVDLSAITGEPAQWPLAWLTGLARFPHLHDTWLGFGHSLPNGDPPQALGPDTRMTGVLLLPPVSFGDEFPTLAAADGRPINIYSILPLYTAEMDFKLEHGTGALLERFDERGVNELLDPGRASVV